MAVPCLRPRRPVGKAALRAAFSAYAKQITLE